MNWLQLRHCNWLLSSEVSWVLLSVDIWLAVKACNWLSRSLLRVLASKAVSCEVVREAICASFKEVNWVGLKAST